MAHLSNPLATPMQLIQPQNALLPPELQDSIRYYTARLTQAAGLLLRLPQSITAQANVLLFRYWLVDALLTHEFSDVSAAVIYTTAKISAEPRSLRSITNVYAYLLSPASKLIHGEKKERGSGPEEYYLSEGQYLERRNRILGIEGQVLNALGFNTHVALPYPLAITYLQALDAFASPKSGKMVAKRAVEHLNDALLSPQMLYLTHQPAVLATAAVYLAARELGMRLPEVEWWEVFDCEREELGFLVVGMGSLGGLAEREDRRWGGKGMITRNHIKGNLIREEEVDEEAEMARLLDQKVEAT